MATISIAATGLTTRSKTISAGDTQRLLAAYKTIYKNSDGSDKTDQQVFDAFADALFSEMRDTVLNIEGTIARKTVNPISLA